MTTPGQEIDAYLDSTRTAEPQRLDVAILFARSMLRELRESTADWERTASALEEIKERQRTTGGDRLCPNSKSSFDPAPAAAHRPCSRGGGK
jgi:hypothetical protein